MVHTGRLRERPWLPIYNKMPDLSGRYHFGPFMKLAVSFGWKEVRKKAGKAVARTNGEDRRLYVLLGMVTPFFSSSEPYAGP